MEPEKKQKKEQENTAEPPKESVLSKIGSWLLDKLYSVFYVVTDLAHIAWHNTLYGWTGGAPPVTHHQSTEEVTHHQSTEETKEISKKDFEKTFTSQLKAYGFVPEFKEDGQIVIQKEKMIAGEKNISIQRENIVKLSRDDILNAEKLSLPAHASVELLHAIASTRKALNIHNPISTDRTCKRGVMHISVTAQNNRLVMSINGEKRLSFEEKDGMDYAEKMTHAKRNIADFKKSPRVLTISGQHFKFKGNEIKVNNEKFISVKDERDVQRVLNAIKDLPLFKELSPQAVAYTLSCIANPDLKAFIQDGQAYNAIKDSLEPQGASHVFTRNNKIIYLAPTENGGKTETTLSDHLSAFEITKEEFFKIAERVDCAKDAMNMNQFIAVEYNREKEKTEQSFKTEIHENTRPLDQHMSEGELAVLTEMGKEQMKIDEENEKNAEACAAAGDLHGQTYAEDEPEL